MNKNNKLNLYEALEASYETPKQAKERLKRYNYYVNEELSNGDIKVAYNPVTKKLLFLGAGTHKASDFGTDAYLGAGKLKSTRRFKDAQALLKKAKQAYNVENATIIGHSLFGTIASYIGSKKDKVITYNKGATIAQGSRDNESAYRSTGDLVSILASGDKNMKTLKPQINQPLSAFEEPKQFNLFQPHAVRNLNEEETKGIQVESSIEPITQPTFELERNRTRQFEDQQVVRQPMFLRG